MKRILSIIAITLVLVVFGAGTWLAVRPPVTGFLAPGAAEIQVDNAKFWEQHLSYRAAGRPYAWYWATAHLLEAQHWTLDTPLQPDLAGLSYNPIVLLRFERVSSGFLKEEIVLDPDQDKPNLARIHIYRRIILPGRLFQ